MRDISALDEPPSVAERSEDVVFARDYAAIVEAACSTLRGKDPVGCCRRIVQTVEMKNALSHEVPFVTFAELHGFPALLRALARAVEREAA